MAIEVTCKPATLGFDEFHRLDEQCFPDEPISEDSFLQTVAADFWGAFSDGQLVGYSYIKLLPDLAWLARVGVDGAHRSRGIGSMLVEAVLAYCHRIGRDTVILYVQQDNPAALRLYEKYGFTVSEESCQYIVPIVEFIESQKRSHQTALTPIAISEVPESQRPKLTPQWSGLLESHDPPQTYVLLFRQADGAPAGYCRLRRDFPGCFPFDLANPSQHLAAALAGLEPLLSTKHDILKLTLADASVAQACHDLGFALNYRLYKMTATLTKQ